MMKCQTVARKNSNSTSTISNAFKQLPKTKLDADGVTLGKISFRFSNVANNLVYLTKLSETAIATLASLMSAGAMACSKDPEEIYISDKSQTNDYKIVKSDAGINLNGFISEGICDVVTTLNKPDQYESIKDWCRPNQDTIICDLGLSRGTNQSGNALLEDCLITTLQRLKDNPRCYQASWSNFFEVAGIIGGAILFVTAIAATVEICIHRYQTSEIAKTDKESKKKSTYDSLPISYQFITSKPTPSTATLDIKDMEYRSFYL